MSLTILQSIILGLIQGITEWLPVSSSGMLVLVMTNFFGITDINILLGKALFLHLGTFFAALIYFRKDVADLFVSLFNYKKSNLETKKILNFLIITTVITSIIGLIILKVLSEIDLNLTGKVITFGIGLLLLVTAISQFSSRKGLRKSKDLKFSDSTILGSLQGLATLPGISRSGITISTLLLKGFDDTSALRLSFLMSLPVVLLGNIFLNMNELSITTASMFGLLSSFIFGLITIHVLIKLSKKVNFAWFVLVFAILMMLSVLI